MKDILRDLEEHRDTLTDPESFSILTEAYSVSEIKLEFELPEDVVVSFDKRAKAQIIIVDVSLPAKKEILWNHFNRKTQQMNNENKKLVAILDKATRNGWTCSLKTSKQCNQGNTLIMLMTTRLYNRVTAEADAELEEEKPGAAGRKKSDETPINANDVMDSNVENKEPPQKKQRTAGTRKRTRNSDKKKAVGVTTQWTSPRKQKLVSYGP